MSRPKEQVLSRSLHDTKLKLAEVDQAYDDLYGHSGEPVLGWPLTDFRVDIAQRRENSTGIIGLRYGDEGKGRVVLNLVEKSLADPNISRVVVTRWQGGNNAGHTLHWKGESWAQHVVPSGIHLEGVHGIMDSGMVIHPEDLYTEIDYIEATGVDLADKLFLSQDAILCTDIERAREVLNRFNHSGAKGGTGRGIGPSYAGSLSREGLKIHQLMAPNWKEVLSKHYDIAQATFATSGFKNLHEVDVPDFAATKRTLKAQIRPVGTKAEFLDRLENARDRLISRGIVNNTFLLHQKFFPDESVAYVFEGAQAVGLHPQLGTRPDVTSSDTTFAGIQGSTRYWRESQILRRLGVFKATYDSSVGARHMPTQVDLQADIQDNDGFTAEQQWASWVREFANEKGTTTGRFRDILHLNAESLAYNTFMGGAEALVATHLDIARENEPIQVCIGYRDIKHLAVPYQPGLIYQEGLIPQYIELPSWDGQAVSQAKTVNELPINSLRYLSFLQQITGFPIAAVTTGPSEDNIIFFPGYFE